MQKRSFAYTAALAAILVGGLGSAALADRMRDGGMMGHMGMMGGPMMGPMFDFDTVDANKDGKITADEFKAHRVAEMKAVDSDGDGKITAEELTAMHMKAAEARAKAMAPQMLERMDVDGDGAVSVTELLAMPGPGAQMIDRLDADGDGAVTKAELEAARANPEGMMGHGMGEGHGMDDGHGRGHGKHGQGYGGTTGN
ncbi:hypothetical protein GCM10011452_27140 [Gemmobacter lanyuensis]|uniref:EF-hand domain-containing protein n=1 Tax=Gemmobacter lanyuensis TaxID=1054497 RepID=A0A918J0L3_9RHOB|nr:EF-hand domain-containing protein [Gemmobacter lanyuensis]GGW37330.1 hypothetical protein GCM10011452_27140 [Gemmobacter lanyuensis]